ncbi:hypothetical protein D3C81_2153710 [compost metagenome]
MALSGKLGTKQEAIEQAKNRLLHYKDKVEAKLVVHPDSPGLKNPEEGDNKPKAPEEKNEKTKESAEKSDKVDWGFLD